MKLRRCLLKQVKKDDCGVTTLRMLLAVIYKNPRYLTMPVPSNVDNFLVMKKLLAEHGVKTIGYTLTNKQILTQIEGPFIMQLKEGGINHFVLAKRQKTNIEINDPKGNYYYFPLKTLYKYNISNILVVDCVDTPSKPPVRAKMMSIKYFLFPALFLLLISIGMSFVGYEGLEYISYASFTLAAIIKILEQTILLKGFIKFDHQMVRARILTIRHDFEQEFIALQKAKEVVFTHPLATFSSLTTTLLMLVILIINHPYLVIISIFCLLAAIYIDRLNHICGTDAWQLEFKINDLFRSQIQNRAKLYEKIIYSSQQIAKKRTFSNSIIIFLIAGFTFLLMTFTKTYSLNFFIFYFIGFCYFFSEVKKLLNLVKNKSGYYQAINILQQ